MGGSESSLRDETGNDSMTNPHVLRKFEQAQRNMMVRIGFTCRSLAAFPGALVWNGNTISRKEARRSRYWARQMERWMNKLFP